MLVPCHFDKHNYAHYMYSMCNCNWHHSIVHVLMCSLKQLWEYTVAFHTSESVHLTINNILSLNPFIPSLSPSPSLSLPPSLSFPLSPSLPHPLSHCTLFSTSSLSSFLLSSFPPFSLYFHSPSLHTLLPPSLSFPPPSLPPSLPLLSTSFPLSLSPLPSSPSP